MSDQLPVVVVVSGAPATGKTTLALRLGPTLRLPVIVRDRFKEVLFDTFGIPTLGESEKFGLASFRLMDATLGWLLDAEIGAIYESNFRRGLSEKELRVHLPRCRMIQLFCWVEWEMQRQRYEARARGGERHPGHHDLARLRAAEARGGELAWRKRYDQPLDLAVPTLRVDTTDGFEPPVGEIVAFVRRAAHPK